MGASALYVDPLTGLPLALLTARDAGEIGAELVEPIAVPVGQGEAVVISSQLNGIAFELPPLPKVMCELVDRAGAAVERIELMRGADRHWRGRLYIAHRDGAVQVCDIRPSDAISLSLYCGVGLSVPRAELDWMAPAVELAQGSMPQIARLTELAGPAEPAESERPAIAPGRAERGHPSRAFAPRPIARCAHTRPGADGADDDERNPLLAALHQAVRKWKM